MTTLLLILDGWGEAENSSQNAIALANTPTWDYLYKNSPHSKLIASGPAVGLPENQAGNSEVGHLHIGSGRVVEQDLVKINDTHSFFKAFQKDYNPYQKMRERFRVLKKIDIFDNYFRIQEYEDELSSRTNKSHEFSPTKLQIRSSLNDLLR